MSRVQMLPTTILIDLYLDGVATGIASALADLAGALPEEIRDQMTDDMVATLKGDPLAMEAIRQEVTESLRGIDSGPKNLTAFGPGAKP